MATKVPTEQAPSDPEPQLDPAAIPAESAPDDSAPAAADLIGDSPPEQVTPLATEGEAGAETSQPQSIVVMCPNCQTSFPLTAETEAVIPPLTDRYIVCGECEGTTWVKTPSADPQYAVEKCKGCGGLGYLAKDGLTVSPTLPAQQQPPWDGATWDEERQLWV